MKTGYFPLNTRVEVASKNGLLLSGIEFEEQDLGKGEVE